jgi:hypothetical protein
MSEFKDTVNGLVDQMEQGDDGKWALPADVAEGLDEQTEFAVTAERRYRDTQSAYTRAQQDFKRQEAISVGLEERLLTSEVVLTKEQKFELNELKKTNPEAWRAKLNEYEEAGKAILSTELETIRTESGNKGELEVRNDQMAAWSETTGITLTDEVIANDLPPRFIKELESGKITFEEFLDKAGEFLKTPKVIAGADEDAIDDTKDLGRVAGGQEPSKTAQEGDFEETYVETIF